MGTGHQRREQLAKAVDERSIIITGADFTAMRHVRCRVCGLKVRRDRLDAHMRAVHRSRMQTRIVPLAIAITAVVLVTVVAIFLIRQSPQNEENTPPPADPNAVAVGFTTDDGWLIRGTYYRGDPSMPLLILVPGVNESRAAFGPLLTDLRAKSYNVLAYDSRGAGESVLHNGVKKTWLEFTDSDFQASVKDLVAAKYYALSSFQSAPRIAVIGASIGANVALVFAANDTSPELKALVLLSPGDNFRGIESAPALDTLNGRATRPDILFAASEGDVTSSAGAQNLNRTYAGKHKLALLSGDRHGTVMLTDPTFRTQVVEFLADAFAS
jgi:pimeloyl-ACP methyl ester carboxylesterase